MTLEVLVIALARVAGSLPVARWAFAGALVAILVDLSDLFLMNLLHLGGVPDYQSADKGLDQVYLALFLLVALRWRPVLAATALTLYLFRLAGFAVFEASQERWVLFAFPNVFEFFFVAVAGREWWHRRRAGGGAPAGETRAGVRWSPATVAVTVLGATLAKLAHEYVIHVARALDGFTAVEAVEAIWRFLVPG